MHILKRTILHFVNQYPAWPLILYMLEMSSCKSLHLFHVDSFLFYFRLRACSLVSLLIQPVIHQNVISSLQCEVFQQKVSPEKHWLQKLMFKFAGANVLLLFSFVYYIRLKLCTFCCFTLTANAWRCSSYLFRDTSVRSRLFFRLPLFQHYNETAYYVCYVAFSQTNQRQRKWLQMMVSYLICL